jgi:plastocyanin
MTARWVRLLIVVAIATLLVVPAGLSHARRLRISVIGNQWSPAHPAVDKGDVVVWRNNGSRLHDVVSYGGNWRKRARLAPGQTSRRRFRRAGTFKFRCTLHSTLRNGSCRGMCGMIHVLRSGHHRTPTPHE